MVKTKRKSILRTLLCGVFALCMAVGLSSLFASGTTAYAAAVTTPSMRYPLHIRRGIAVTAENRPREAELLRAFRQE